MRAIKELQLGFQRRNVERAVTTFGQFVQTTVETGLPDVTSDVFQQTLSRIAGLPSGYEEERLEENGVTILLKETEFREYSDILGPRSCPVKWMTWQSPDGQEIRVGITLDYDRFDARIYLNGRDPDIIYSKAKWIGAKWVGVS